MSRRNKQQRQPAQQATAASAQPAVAAEPARRAVTDRWGRTHSLEFDAAEGLWRGELDARDGPPLPYWLADPAALERRTN